MKWIFLVLLFPFHAYSSTCISTEDNSFVWNQKYADEILIDTEFFDGSYTVAIEAPTELGGYAFNGISLSVDNIDDPTFYTMLFTGEVDETHRAWYSVRAEMVRKHFITVSFGFHGCEGIAVTKQVVFN